MSQVLRLMAVALALILPAGAALAQNAECKEVRFSEDVLDRFPRAADACLDVISKDGQQYAVFKAHLQEVRGTTLRVRFKLPDGSQSSLMSVPTSSKKRVLIDGKPYSVSELAPDQELTAYVRVDSPMMALAPVTDTEPLEAVPLVAAEDDVRVAQAPAMPRTASPIGAIALLGQFCLAVALALALIRKRDR